MMTRTVFASVFAAALAFAVAGPAVAEDISEEDVAKINAMLADMNCQMDEDDIEKEDEGFELDDVFCEDGQYDIELDGEFNVVERRKE